MNATALDKIGVSVIPALEQQFLLKIKQWVKEQSTTKVNYPDSTQEVIDNVLSKYIIATELSNQLVESI